ncbi:MAG: DUF6391 domain-containing protein [Chloroflexi bacterium]|nr:DUF6391 domain-containing protein [Chloroflexota bacterium]
MHGLMIFSGLFGALAVIFWFFGQPIWSLLNVPRQLNQLWQGVAVRRNHAIEHATVNVLEERYGSQLVDGCATTEGFRIRAAIDPALLLDAAREGLLRLQRGERSMAIYRRCATALSFCFLTVASIGLGMVAFLDMLSSTSIFLALTIAGALTPKLSPLFQRFFTTSLDVKGMSIGAIELVPPTLFMGLSFAAGGAEFAVRTKPARRIYQPPYRYGERVPVYVPVENNTRQR